MHLPRASPVVGAIRNHILYLGPRYSSHCVHQKLLLLANHLTVHQNPQFVVTYFLRTNNVPKQEYL